MSEKQEQELQRQDHQVLLSYWQDAVARYIQAKREKAGLTQDDLAVKALTSQGAISGLERGNINFTLDTLLRVLEPIHGDISEAFQAASPSEFRTELTGPDRWLLLLLVEILNSGDPTARDLMRVQLEVAHKLFVRQRTSV